MEDRKRSVQPALAGGLTLPHSIRPMPFAPPKPLICIARGQRIHSPPMVA